MTVLTTREGLGILALWLQDNIDMESELIFDNDVDRTDSAQLLPCVETALGLLPPDMTLPVRPDDAEPAGLAELAAVAVESDFLPGDDLNNADRAALAAELLCLFATRTGMARSGEPVETVLVDVLADLMHLADRLAIADFHRLVAVAAMHHRDEADEG